MSIKKTRWILLGFLLLSALFIAGFLLLQSPAVPDDPLPNVRVVQTAPEFSYLLKEYQGKIGIFKAGEETPFDTIDIYIETLPAADQTALTDGVYVEDDEKLQKIIEDYES